MADQSYGLRFDIYERVHLSEDVIGIEELEEIELYPKIQVIPGEEYASLRGHLLLAGLYRGEGETRSLEHWIPVEITIPLSRVNRLEDITVEIENFDVDLLSARSLNITGVLSLQGVETSSLAVEADSWKDREFTTAHVVPAIRDEEETGGLSFAEQEEVHAVPELPKLTEWQAFPEEVLKEQRGADEPEAEPTSLWLEEENEAPPAGPWTDKEYALPAQSLPPQSEFEQFNDVWFKEVMSPFAEPEAAERLSEPVKPEAAPAQAAEKEPLQFAAQDNELANVTASEAESQEPAVPSFSEAVEEKAAGGPNKAAAEAAKEPENPAHAEAEEKKELKIALGSKKGTEEKESESFGLKKLISSRPQHDLPTQAEFSGADPEAAEAGDDEELLWKNLFIQGSEEQTPFRKVKLVIVQREETLDDIAERYHLSSRELQLYNRLSENHLAEGQILYIP
ncbi:LysM peptidoglycan-binding domain-containing protein [Paenibacillus oralis]|uniref:LysM peptidoglycan-binding domain-containing protein n=1 Tax=Paenibacillus oralis TaxID=2490856 RepID=A0A3P3TVX2_9BACL|nr:LysM peptidoglycan-binding domain-containing protein [Paenibacillus oralis]RRJ61559.1 LysM peptidoglycan-binding domain-containing protein [Paenibacillus oralis]